MRKLFLFLPCILLLLLTSSLNAQNSRTITGSVLADDKSALEGVTVSEKGTAQKVTTSDGGQFSTNVTSNNPVLIFTYVGYIEKQIAVNDQKFLSVEMSRDVKSFDDVVVIGYGTVKK